MSEGQSNPLRLAIAGMGLRGVSMTGAILRNAPGIEVVALADTIPARAELTRERYGLSVPVFDDPQQCLDEAQPEALAVYTPDVHHEGPAIAALKRNIHVYCEKPMSTTLEACDRMIAAAEASDAVFYMGHNMRLSPYFHTVHEIIAAGEIGRPLTLEMNEYYHGGRTYFRRWNRLMHVGGGLWITKSCHDFDMMSWLAGDEPVRVCAVGGRKHFLPRAGAAERCRDCDLRWDCDDYQPPRGLTFGGEGSDEEVRFWQRWQELGESEGYLPHDACLYRGDIETLEYGIATVQFAGGACATYAMNCVTTPQVSGRWATVLGTSGALRADPLAQQIHVSYRGAKAARTYDVSALARGGHGGADQRALGDFLRACRAGTPPVASCADGRRAVRMGLAAQRSMDEGRVVTLDEA